MSAIIAHCPVTKTIIVEVLGDNSIPSNGETDDDLDESFQDEPWELGTNYEIMAAQSLLSLSQVLTQTTVTSHFIVRYNEYTGTISYHQSYVQQRQPPKSTAQLPSITSLAEDPFTMSASDSMKAWTVTEEELAAVQK